MIKVISEYTVLVDCLNNKEARKYLKFGFIIRALQIKETVLKLLEITTRAGGDNLDPYETCHVNIYLNSFYLNVLGALDNLAWVLQHEFSIIEGANENNNKRNSVVLFGKKFRENLNSVDNELKVAVEDSHDWFYELKSLRDPAAHRIPLYCPPGVISKKDEERFRLAKKQFNNQSYPTDSDSYMRSLHELYIIGKFKPVFSCFNKAEGVDVIYPISTTIKRDYKSFGLISGVVHKFLKKKLMSSV